MSQLDWSRLLKQQDQYVHEEDKRQQQRILKLKMLYKNQLEKMIQKHRDHAHDEKDQDRKLVMIADEIDKRKMMFERQQALNKAKMKGQMAKDNLKSNYLKRQELLHQNQEQKKYFAQRFKKAKTEVQLETESRLRHRQLQKQQLSKAYDSQIMGTSARRKLQKLEDEKFTKLRDQIQQQKQENRRQYFEKIRNGYKQNPQVYQHSAQMLLQQQKQRSQFLKKLSEQDKQREALAQKKKKQEINNKKRKEISNFNRQFHETKALRQRYQSIQETAQYHDQFKTLENQLYSQKCAELLESDKKRNMLKIQLEKQIDERYIKEGQRNKMNQREYLINKGSRMPSLPGLTRDYAVQKQHRILENFLGGSDKKIQF